MASAEKIRARIRNIAARPNNTTLADIEWVMSQLGQFEEFEVVGNVHRKAWSSKETSFSVCTHHKGRKQIKSVYVSHFLNAMMEIGWYE
jgi:hypothetical protein